MKISPKGKCKIIVGIIAALAAIIVAFLQSYYSQGNTHDNSMKSNIVISIGKDNEGPITINSNNHNSKINSENSK